AVGTPSADRQFNPSAALVKAVLVNGARRMTGFYTGDDGGDRAQDGQYPSNGQGFGLVNLDNSLFLPNDPTNLWVKDVWRDTYNGKAVNPDVANTPNPEAFTAPSVPQTRSYMLHVLPGQPLDVTLAWTDQPSLDPAVPTLINDLNLTVTGPDAVVRKGNAFNTRTAAKAATWETGAGGSADNRNNVERVRVEAPAEGDYTVTVSTGTLSGTQNQGFALAAAGQITGSGAPALGSGWKVDETPNAAPTVVSSTVENVSSDTAVVNVATSELTKAVLTTTNGGVFPSVDTVGADGDFGQLTSGFTPEIPDNTGFPPAAGAHDVLAREHRIRITGPRARDVNMSVQLTDLEGKTATVFLGTLPAEAVYQPPLDDIAQFSSVDDTYGGFGGKSTQMYLGNLTGLGSLLGAYKFTLPPTVDAATVGGAVVEASSGHDLASHDAQQWKMRTDMLPNATESGWQTKKYADIHSATAIASLNPSTSVRKGNQSTYAQAVTCTQMEDFRGNVADHNVAFRMEADTPETDAAVSFETGVNRRSRGPEFRPRLVLLKQQPDGTLLDSRPCDPNAPAPAISDVRVEQNKNTDGTTYSGVVSWRTDVPSDSTVVIRPKGANALSWTEVAVPGRTTTHIVEVRGLSLDQDYEFVVNSASCNGANTTATNNSQGYAFVAPGTAPVSNAAGPYDFESDQGWTVTQENRGDGFPTSSTTWTRGPGGWHSVGQSYEATPYQDFTNTALASPSFATTAGRVRVSWWQQVDLEPDSDFLYLEYNNGGGWIEAAKFTGQHGDFSNNTFEPQTVVFDLTPSPALRVRFRLESDLAVSNPTYKGARVDDVAVAQGGRGEPLGPFASKAPSAGSSVTAPVVPLRLKPNAADLAAGTARCAPITTKVVLPPPPPPVNGYWLTAADAGLFSYGAAGFVGSRGGQPLNQPVVGMAQNATDHKGYWQVASDGGIFNYGSAGFFGSMGSTPLNRPVVGMAAAPDGKGYWLVAADGGIFNFGSARFFGSTGSMTLNKPIVGMAATADGGGYWLVASDGGIFAFGNAVGRWYGSTGDMTLVSPVVGMEPTPLGDGYWLVARDGGVFAFGKAAALYHGSAQSRGVNNIVGMAAAKDGLGYWLVGANGSVYNFGNAPAFGGAEGLSLVRPVVGIDGY
ncbi:MAG TPA: hypothetical protein VGO92_00715, partial [Acidimicrobiales bacterium]|nr:hypothetical protein [Acidimicrobiales bacterium]